MMQNSIIILEDLIFMKRVFNRILLHSVKLRFLQRIQSLNSLNRPSFFKQVDNFVSFLVRQRKAFLFLSLNLNLFYNLLDIVLIGNRRNHILPMLKKMLTSLFFSLLVFVLFGNLRNHILPILIKMFPSLFLSFIIQITRIITIQYVHKYIRRNKI